MGLLMKPLKFILLAGLLSACVATPYTTAWREGVTFAQLQRVETNCKVEAVNRVPAAIMTSTTPVYRSPSNIQCSTYGNYTSCHDYGGQVFGGDVVTEDRNAPLREQVLSQCLAKQGFSVVSLPACTPAQKKLPTVSLAAGRLPAASAVLCVTETGYVLK